MEGLVPDLAEFPLLPLKSSHFNRHRGMPLCQRRPGLIFCFFFFNTNVWHWFAGNGFQDVFLLSPLRNSRDIYVSVLLLFSFVFLHFSLRAVKLDLHCTEPGVHFID